MVSFGAVTLALNYAIRYVGIILLVIISPIVVILYATSYTSALLKHWVKLFISNVVMQNGVVILLMLPLAVKDTTSNIFKIVLMGSIYLLYRLNQYVKEMFSEIGNVR